MANIKVNGYWFADFGAFGDLQWSSKHRGGSEAASWRVDSMKRLPFRPGQLVEVVHAGWGVFSGTLLEPDGDTMHARGLWYQAQDAHALDLTGAATTVPDTAVSHAIYTRNLLKWRWFNPLSGVAFGAPSGVQSVASLLDAWAESVGKVWRVDGRGILDAYTPATTPKWHVVPGAGQLTVAEDSFASSLILRYLDSTSGAWTSLPPLRNATAADRFGEREAVEAMPEDAPAISAAQATSIAQTRLAELSRPGWANGLDLAGWELTTTGGTPANPYAVRGGDLIRIHGQTDITIASGPKPYVDVIADEVSYVDGSDTVQIKPLGMQARAFTDVLKLALT